MIYFDNAATGGFKPAAVTDCAVNTLKYLLCNPGRSEHRLSLFALNAVTETRNALSSFFNGGGAAENVIFTKNCTEALNTAIFGILNKGDHVITTAMEHNSTLRPLFHLESEGVISLDIVDNGFESVKEKIRENTRLICCNQVSNVNGEENRDIEKIGRLSKENGIVFLVDGAQSAGHIKIDMKSMNINVLCIPTHKGMYGFTGGCMIFDESVFIKPLTFGGTGTETFNKDQPAFPPERFESGTLNLPVIVSLRESVFYVEKNMDFFKKRLTNLTETLIKELNALERITVFSKKNGSGIVAFSVAPFSSGEVADFLNKNYDIAVRSGFHCAPLQHKRLKTDKDGLIRVSLAAENTENELSVLIAALRKLCLS